MLVRRRSLTTFPLLSGLMLLLAGCASRTRPATVRMSGATLKTATREELVTRINREAAQIQTLNATVDIKASIGGSKKGQITEYQEVRGYILARKPGWLRMIGLLPVLRNRAFDMVSDGTSFKLWIPPKNRFVVGANEISKPSKQPLENLRPQHIYDALLLQPIDQNNGEIAVLEQGFSTLTDAKGKPTALQPEYTLNVIRRGNQGWFLTRKIFFDRTNLEPYRQVVYDKNGYVATDAHYTDFKDYSGIQFPSRISIWRPQEEYSVTVTIEKLTINSQLTDEQFALERPPGAQLVRLDSDSANQAQDGQPN
jgi:outer membrane lipoprotein-sorting protein